MRLTQLEIFGFKSFAQKIVIPFDPGITSIVGPNGCGKSNVVEAIRWVLGEQRAGTFRSSRMEDVIFAGTRQRKALGMSEVSLTIENYENVLPVEFNEVMLTRRLFRSGESDYLLNKIPCRLLDISNLLMDTGLGQGAYSVMEQGMVDEIISEKTENRRRILEEAAGITKYKTRRRSTWNRLEATQADLTRIEDIIAEVKRQVDYLGR
ncbi:MAG TPA: chromosome segregation protein SMC, partial [Candidatus Latescibacteria bacterium]|nr:chromosome segregation protein SMC [Candidatus Latescibacterota bacterium]